MFLTSLENRKKAEHTYPHIQKYEQGERRKGEKGDNEIKNEHQRKASLSSECLSLYNTT
jgi:hypothetical protein